MVRSSSLAAISANISAATTRNSKSGKAAVASPAPKARGTATAAAAKPSSKANSKQLYKLYQQQWQKLKPQLDAVTDPAIVASARQVGKDVFKLSVTNSDEQLQPELDELHLQIKDTLQYLAFASRTALTQPKVDTSKQAKPFANQPEMLVADLRTNKKKGAAVKGRPTSAAAKQSASKKAASKKADTKPEQASKKRKATRQSPVEEEDAASDADPFDEGMLTDAESEKENDVDERQRSKKSSKSGKHAKQPASATKRSASKRAAHDSDDDGPALQSPSRVSLKNQTEVRSKRRRLNA